MRVSEETKYIKGSKVPFNILVDYFINGLTLNDFVSAYPWVNRKEVVKKLDELKKPNNSYASA